jgi:hypothetical protein
VLIDEMARRDKIVRTVIVTLGKGISKSLTEFAASIVAVTLVDKHGGETQIGGSG